MLDGEPPLDTQTFEDPWRVFFWYHPALMICIFLSFLTNLPVILFSNSITCIITYSTVAMFSWVRFIRRVSSEGQFSMIFNKYSFCFILPEHQLSCVCHKPYISCIKKDLISCLYHCCTTDFPTWALDLGFSSRDYEMNTNHQAASHLLYFLNV